MEAQPRVFWSSRKRRRAEEAILKKTVSSFVNGIRMGGRVRQGDYEAIQWGYESFNASLRFLLRLSLLVSFRESIVEGKEKK